MASVVGPALATTLVIAIAAAALRSALRLVTSTCPLAGARCRRWALIAAAAALVSCGLLDGIRIERAAAVLVAIAAAECWLVIWTSSPPVLPPATVRRWAHRQR